MTILVFLILMLSPQRLAYLVRVSNWTASPDELDDMSARSSAYSSGGMSTLLRCGSMTPEEPVIVASCIGRIEAGYISLLTADSLMKELPALREQAADATELEVPEVL